MRNKKPICRTSPDGTKRWYLNHQIHREDGPAIEWPDGTKYWVLNDYFYPSETDYYRELYKRGKISREELFINLI